MVSPADPGKPDGYRLTPATLLEEERRISASTLKAITSEITAFDWNDSSGNEVGRRRRQVETRADQVRRPAPACRGNAPHRRLFEVSAAQLFGHLREEPARGDRVDLNAKRHELDGIYPGQPDQSMLRNR